MNSMFEMTTPMSRVLDAAFRGPRTCSTHDQAEGMTWSRSPRADVLEGDTEFLVRMDLPGVKAENLEISLENQVLTVKASRENEVPEGFKLARHERAAKSDFQRTFNLGNGVDEGKIEATFTDGVLELKLPKSERSLPRRIDVK